MLLPSSGRRVGTIEMRYSRTCRTQWIRVQAYSSNCSSEGCQHDANITRNNGPDGPLVYYYNHGLPYAGAEYQWSLMVYTPNTLSCGSGGIDTGMEYGYPDGNSSTWLCG